MWKFYNFFILEILEARVAIQRIQVLYTIHTYCTVASSTLSGGSGDGQTQAFARASKSNFNGIYYCIWIFIMIAIQTLQHYILDKDDTAGADQGFLVDGWLKEGFVQSLLIIICIHL